MANRIKMVQKELMFSLFKQNWSDRKIHKSIGLHRTTISRYRKKWLRVKQEKQSSPETVKDTPLSKTSFNNPVQSVPLSENKMPTDRVVHFEVPTDPDSVNNKTFSKSKAACYHDEIKRKLQNGQHAVSIYQDLVSESQFKGSYDSIKRYVRKLKHRTPDLYARIESMIPSETDNSDVKQPCSWADIIRHAVNEYGYENLDGEHFMMAFQDLGQVSALGVFTYDVVGENRSPRESQIRQVQMVDGKIDFVVVQDFFELPDTRPPAP